MHRPSDRDVNWMSPVQVKSPPVQVKEPYGNFDMVTCRLSSCKQECTMYTCRQCSKASARQYIEKERERKVWLAVNHNTRRLPVSHLANEFDVRSELHGQVSELCSCQNFVQLLML